MAPPDTSPQDSTLRGLEVRARANPDDDQPQDPAERVEPSPALVAALEQALETVTPDEAARTIAAAVNRATPGNVAALDSDLRFAAHFVMDSLGVQAEMSGDYAAARERYRVALELGELAEDRMVALNRLGLLQKSLGRPDSAAYFFRTALDLAASEGDPSEDLLYFQNSTQSNLGLAFDEWSQPDSALAYYGLALQDAESVGVTPDELALTLNNLGVAWRRAGVPDSALVFYHRAEAMGIGDRSLLELNRGLVYGDLSEVEPAREALEQALAIRLEAGNASKTAEVQRHLAGLLHRVADSAEASLALYAAANASLAEVRTQLEDDADRVAWADVSANLTLYSDWADAVLDAAYGTAASETSLGVAERGRAQSLKLMLGDGEAEGADIPSTPEAIELLTSGGMAALVYDVGHDDLRMWSVSPDGRVSAARCLIAGAEIGAQVEAYREAMVPWGAALQRMSLELGAPPKEAVDRRRTVDNRFAGPNGTPRTSPALNCPLTPGGESEDVTTPARLLSSLLLPRDFLDSLEEGQPLLIVPSGDLTLLPFSALPTGRGPLGQLAALSFAPSLEVWALGNRDLSDESTVRDAKDRGWPAGARPLVVADPTMPVEDAAGARWSLAPLPGARREGASISQLLGVEALSGDAATEATFVSAVASAPVVHVATHGVAFGEPARSRQSFLAFAPGDAGDGAADGREDGFLSVDEVMNPERFPDLSARLVVLSACQTGLGEVRGAEGTVGLQRAFLARGAQAVLVSLWSVSDEGTYELITRFYRFWLEDGYPPAEALRRAQRALADDGYSAADWAAFQIYGQG